MPAQGARWLSPAEAARRCPLSRKAIYGAIRRGELQASKRCGRWMIGEEELGVWIAGGAVAREREPSPMRRRAGRPVVGSFAAIESIEAEAKTGGGR
jgi:hypothetical protein